MEVQDERWVYADMGASKLVRNGDIHACLKLHVHERIGSKWVMKEWYEGEWKVMRERGFDNRASCRNGHDE